MIHTQILRPFLLLLTFGGSLLFAQEPDVGKAKKPAGRIAWLVATSIPDNLENPVSVMSGTEIVQATLSKRSIGEPVKIPSDGIIRLVRKVENPNDPSKPSYLTLAQALVPEGVEKSLIILAPVPKKEGSDLVFITKIQNLANFKGGDSLFMNLTNLNIAVQLGKKKIGLKAGDTSICDAGGITSATSTAVSYHYFDQPENKWKMISASTVVVQPTRREICIFSWDPRYERVDYHGVTFPVTP